MKKSLYFSLICFALISFISHSLYSQHKFSEQWPSFRGPNASGIIECGDMPSEWNLETGKNIKWKMDIPGLGHSCPVIWGDKLFISTAVSLEGEQELKVGLYGDIDAIEGDGVHQFKIYCLNKNTGEIIWEKLSCEGIPKTKRHTKGSHANCTPAIDGKYLAVHFGSMGLYVYDLEGNLIWEKDLGLINAGPRATDVEWGYASSPIIHDGILIVQNDVTDDNDYIAAYKIETGERIWKTQRDESSTWGGPTVVEWKGKKQVVVNGYKHIGGYDLYTGLEIWRMHGGGDAPTPTPVFAHNHIFINNAHGKYSPIYIISPDAKGDLGSETDGLEEEYFLWKIRRGGAYMQTPLIYKDNLYNLRGNGLLTCFDAITGNEIYKEPLKPGTGITASGIATDNKLYFSTEKGDVYVLKAGNEYELLSVNAMKDVIMASPAISEGSLFFRTQHYLVAVSNDE